MKKSVPRLICSLVAMSLIFISCDKNNDTIPEDLKLESNEISLKPGEQASVKIISGNQGYQVTSSNTDLISASVDAGTISIRAANLNGDAEAIVYVRDSKQNIAQLKVGISSYATFTLSKELIQLEQIQATDSVEVIGGQYPLTITASDNRILDIKVAKNKFYLQAKNRGETILTIKDKRGTSVPLKVQVGGQQEYLNFGDQFFAHTNFSAIAVVDKSIQNLKQVTLEMTCRIQGYRGLQTFMGLEGALIIRGKNDDYRDTHPIEIAGLGDRIMLESSSNFKLNEWMHLALVVDCNQQDVSKKYKLYINGQEDQLIVKRNEETHNSIDLTRSNDGNRFVVGRANGQDWRVIKGAISEVRIWTVARTTTQIQNNRCSLSEDSPEGLLARWDFSSAVSTDYIQDIGGGKYESNLILSDAKKDGAYSPTTIQKNSFSTFSCPF